MSASGRKRTLFDKISEYRNPAASDPEQTDGIFQNILHLGPKMAINEAIWGLC